jgi:hypothetical protein
VTLAADGLGSVERVLGALGLVIALVGFLVVCLLVARDLWR